MLVLCQQKVDAAHGFRVASHALRAAFFTFGHQLRAFEHRDVLLHGGKGHVVSLSQLTDRRVCVHHSRKDVAPRGVGQCGEEVVQLVGRGLLIYNHVVVYITADGSVPRGEGYAYPKSGGNTTTMNAAQTGYTGRYAVCHASTDWKALRPRRNVA